jgi:hypothetical protein
LLGGGVLKVSIITEGFVQNCLFVNCNVRIGKGQRKMKVAGKQLNL